MNRLAVRTATFRRIAITTVLMILYTDGMMQTNGLFSRGYLDMTEGQNAACIVISVRHFLRKLQIQRVESAFAQLS